jgi:hypothetical protein
VRHILLTVFLVSCAHPIAVPRRLPRDSSTLCKPYFSTLSPASVPGTEKTVKQMDAYMDGGVSKQLHDGAHACWGNHLNTTIIDSEGVACLFATLGGHRNLEVKVGTHEEFSVNQTVLECIQKRSLEILSSHPFRGSEVDLFLPINLAVKP